MGQDERRGRDLVATSLDAIAGGQHKSGAYVAAPGYPAYAYAWLRDGAFCAHAMDLHGRHESAHAFHRFVGSAVRAHRDLFTDGDDTPPTRYTLHGRLEDSDATGWQSNFQLDGYGTWLWALRDHERRGGRISNEDRTAAALVSGYLQRSATLPCFDCWEELGDRRHTSTLACVIAGLRAAAELGDDRAPGAADELQERLLTLHVSDRSFVKHEGSQAVDASLLWLAIPFGVVDPDDPVMVRTAARVSDELVGPTGGVWRYLGDSFYGGGEWILLTAWLGSYQVAIGRLDDAGRAREWIEATATPAGHLPEQRTDGAQHPELVQPWVERWGPVATPLLWSHAMYLVLDADLEGRRGVAP